MVFGHAPSLSLKSEENLSIYIQSTSSNRQDEDPDGAFRVELSSQGMPHPSPASPAVSETVRSAELTVITPSSIEGSPECWNARQ